MGSIHVWLYSGGNLAEGPIFPKSSPSFARFSPTSRLPRPASVQYDWDPVIDKTGLTGFYDFTLEWRGPLSEKPGNVVSLSPVRLPI